MVLTTYGRSSGFCVDPIEKKPLYHFLPGTPVLSFGTAGCNLGCKFCQNWNISKSRESHTLADTAMPTTIAQAAKSLGCRSVAFTYNEPIIFHEYAVDVAMACREQGIRTVAVTAGILCDKPRQTFFQWMDAANVDLKAFDASFYKRNCAAWLEPVLETLQYIARETDVWLETTTLLIPGENDSDHELDAMTRWVVEHLGPHIPMHFSAFHPAFRMIHYPPTPADTLRRACQIARQNGLEHAYIGNVQDHGDESTLCPACGTQLIGRTGYTLTAWNLDRNHCCPQCGTRCAGVFEEQPGTWGSRRLPVRMKDFS